MAGLRDSFDVAITDGSADRFAQEAAVADMGSLRRGWETGRIGNEMNPLETEALQAEIDRDLPRANALKAQIAALQQRQRMYAPEVGRLEDIHGVGDALSYGVGQVGQGLASMTDPMAVSAGLNTVGRVAKAIPNPIAQGVGYAAQGAGLLIPYMMSRGQLRGEQIGTQRQDQELMARTTPQQRMDSATEYANLAAVPDSALPGLFGRQISGLSRAEGAVARKAAFGPGVKALGEIGMEGGTEALQTGMSHSALADLNPDRSTEGDRMDLWNSFAGGALGGGPVAAAGAYAEAGHNRLGAGVDAVTGKAGEVVDLLNQSPTVQNVKEQAKNFWEYGKEKVGDVIDIGKQKATDYATGEDGSVSVGNAVDKAKGAYDDATAHIISRADEKALGSSMDNMSPEAAKALPPEAAAALLAKDDARRHEVATRLLTGRKDETSQKLLEAMQDPQDFDALDNAIDHLRQTSEAASLSQVVGEAMSGAASYGGTMAGSAAKGIAGMAVTFGKGVVQGFSSKKNAQTEQGEEWQDGRQRKSELASAYDSWQQRRNETGVSSPLANQVLADIHARPGSMAEQAKEDSYRRAVMAGEYMARATKQSPASSPELVDFMRWAGYEINDLADSWGMGHMGKPSSDAMQRQKSGMSLNLDRIAENMTAVLKENAGDALTYLEQTADPKSAPMFEFLREKVLQGNTAAGREARKQAREIAVSQMVHMLPRERFNQLTQVEGAAEELFHRFENVSRNHAKEGLRPHLDAMLGPNVVNKIMGLVSGLAVEGKPEQQMTEPVSDFDKATAQKKLDKGGSAIYQFGGTLAPRTGGDIFARTDKPKGTSDQDSTLAGEDTTRRPRLLKGTTDPATGKITGTEKMPSGDNMLDFKIKEMEDRVGYVRGKFDPEWNDTHEGFEPGWNDTHEGYGVDTISAHDAMKGMTPGRVLSLYRDYLRQDSAPGSDATPTKEQTEAGRKATAVGMLLGRLVSNTKKPPGDPSQWTERQSQEWKKALVLAKETGHKGEGPVFESMEALDDHQSQVALAEAEAYFRDHHIVRAYSMTDNNPLELSLDHAMGLQKKGTKVEDAVRRDADRAERKGDMEAADQIRSDANLLYFPKGGKDVPISASSLVHWAKKAGDYAGQTQADDETSHAPGAENNLYLKALTEAISAYTHAHADGMPYKINPGGEKEFFKQSRKGKIDGVPDSLMLQNKSYAESAVAGELDAKFKSPLGIKRSVAAEGPNRGRDPADIRDRAGNQRAVRKDQSKQEDFFTAEQREERDLTQDERVGKVSPNLTSTGPRSYMENGKEVIIDQPRSRATHRVDRSGTVASEPKTDDPNATELDFSKGQDPKAEADEITNQKWFTQQTIEKYKPPTTAMRGMSSAKYNAAKLLRTFMGNQVQEGYGVANGVAGSRNVTTSYPGMSVTESIDETRGRTEGGPQAGDREAITLLRTALMPSTEEAAAGKRFEAYRVAPLIHLVSNNKEAEGEGFRRLTNAQYFENAGATPGLIKIIRRGSAQVLLTRSNMSDAHRLTLARELIGDSSIQHKNLVPALEAFLAKNGGEVSPEDMAVNWGDPALRPTPEKMKVQPAPHVAPPAVVKQKAAAAKQTTAVSASSAQAEFDSVLADMEKDPLFATKGAIKPYAESTAGQAAIDRARAAPDAAETARRARNTSPEALAEQARKARNAAATKVDPKVAALQAQLDQALAALQSATTATTGVAAPAKPAAVPKVATPPPEGYVVKAPSAVLQSKIDAAVKPGDGTYLSAIKAAIQRNEMWAASGEVGPNLSKIDIPMLKKWAAMTEDNAKVAATTGTGSANSGQLVRKYQAAGGTGNPLGKPGGEGRKLNAQSDNDPTSRKPRLITRLADDRKVRFANDRSEGVFRSGRGTDTFGPLEDGFAYYHAFDSGHTYTAIVPTEFIPRLEAYLKTASPEKEANALGFFGAQLLVYDITTGDVQTFAPVTASPVHQFLKDMGALEEAKTTKTASDGNPIMRIKGVSDLETAKFLATSLAYSKHTLGEEKIFADWTRITGANEGKKGSGWFNAQTDTAGPAEATPEQMAEATKWLEKVAPGTILKFIKESGYSGEFIEAQNLINVSTTAAAGIMNTTYHEGLHKFFAQFVRSNPKLQKMFEGFANDPRILARLNELLKDYPAALAQLSDGEERLAYAFQFWKAGLLKVDNEHRSFLQKVAAIFRRVLGMVRDSEHALAIFQAFDSGQLAEPSVAAKVIAEQLGKGAMALRARRGLDGLTQGLAAAVLPAEVIMKANPHSETARKLGSILFTNPGEEKEGGGKVGYLNAKRSEEKRWANQANSIFEKMDKGDIEAVQKHMQAQTELEDIKLSVHRDAVIALRITLDDFHTYMTDAGLKIGKVNKYYPTVWSVDALHKNKAEFIKMLVNKYAQQMNPDGGNAHKAAERIWASLIDRNGLGNKALYAGRDREDAVVDLKAPKAALREDGVLSPFFAGQEQQTLWWLDGKDKEAYQSKNMTHTLSQYFHQGVRAAEYHSRFGENGIKLEIALKKIRGELTTASNKLLSSGEIKNDADRVKWLGRQTRDISMAVGAIEGTLGKDISPNMRKFNSYMIAYQNIRLLPYMIFSSFVDPLAQVARGAPVSAALETFTYGMKAVFKAWADLFRDMPKEQQKDEWTKIAEHIGAIEVAMFNHHVAEEYSSVYMSPLARKINETLFKLNGMEAWDRANRTMATKWAVRFIEQHKGLPDKAHSARWLTELGLTPASIPLNADGQLITTADELSVVKGITLADAKQQIAPIHAALNRWVEGAVISPNAAQRPNWSSDPNYAAMFHLKQFSYSFQQTIMKRALNEMDHGNLKPITALAGFVPTMLCADLIKGLVQGAGSLPPYMAGMDAGERIMHAIKRSGLGGAGDIGVNALEDWSSLGGPAFEQAVDAVRDDFGRTTVKALPLHAMGEYLFTGGKQAVGGTI